MSRENVEFVEGLVAGAVDMDKQALLAALPELIAQACDPDIEWVEDPNAPTAASTTGTRPSNSRGNDGWSSGRSTGSRLSGSSTAAMMCSSSLASTDAE